MAAAAASPHSAASILRFTYQLGRSIYIPLTSRCNSVPLPVTRGPGFALNSDVVDVLRNVRMIENSPGWMNGAFSDESSGRTDSSVHKVAFPEYDLPLVTSLYNYQDEIKSAASTSVATSNNTSNDGNNIQSMKRIHIQEDSIQPSIEMLVDQVAAHLEHDLDIHEVCIAGEGEPTLRMDALLAIARTVQSFNQQQQQNDQQSRKQIKFRLITNGLCYSIPHLGYSNNNSNKILLPKLRYTMLRDLIDAGVSRLSVALNTANRHEYDVLMQPACYTGGGRILTDDDTGGGGGTNANTSDTTTNASSSSPYPPMMPGTAHDLICEFIMDATKLGMDVEITGVDRPEIDKVEMERLARLLLSVAPKNKKGRVGRRSVVRWRPYFE
eukprot:scaffold2779_cov149-Skeletonema_menzelii.AAC.1